MRVELKDFQRDAVVELSNIVAQMRRNWKLVSMPSATLLSAPTGSGKTVMAAAIIEALFFGNDELGIEADPTATVLWLSDSPNLNAQTSSRLTSVSNLLADSIMDHRHLTTVDSTFCAAHEQLERQVVHFLSRDMLSKNGKLTKGGEENAGRTFWDVLDATIQDPNRTLYMFIDEAHRGLSPVSDRQHKYDEKQQASIYSQLIDGTGGHLGAPIVIGISATAEKFEQMMRGRNGRTWFNGAKITPAQVQESGLLKDIVELHVPDGDAPVAHQYLDLAAERLLESERKWAEYCKQQHITPVKPLMVVQVADKTTDEQLRDLAAQLCKRIPSLDLNRSFANVFSGNQRIFIPPNTNIPHINPESVEETRNIRILFAKEAVSNGWDCPRAEVLYSQRHHTQPAYITQLLGRIVRTPLGRRVEGDEFLNSVACFLPEFNPKSTRTVVDYLTGKLDDYSVPASMQTRLSVTPCTWLGAPIVDGGQSGSVFTEQEMTDLANVFNSLRTVRVRREPANPYQALVNVVSFLCLSELDPATEEDSRRRFVSKVNGLIDYEQEEFTAAYRSVEAVQMHTIAVNRSDRNMVSQSTAEQQIDDIGLDQLVKDASRRFGKLLFNEYCLRMYENHGTEPRESKLRLAAAVRCLKIMGPMDQWAKDLRNEYLDRHQVEYATLPDDLRAKADQLLPMSDAARVTPVIPPKRWEQESQLKKYERHLLYNPSTGMTPLKLNGLEQYVVGKEMGRARAVAFYRNPAQDSNTALSFPYLLGDEERSVHPDFIFFVRDGNGDIRPAIIDPHGDQFADTLPKLAGYVEYVRRFPNMFVQVLMVADRPNSSELRYVDLLDPTTQDAIVNYSGTYAGDLFTGPLSKYYGDPSKD